MNGYLRRSGREGFLPGCVRIETNKPTIVPSLAVVIHIGGFWVVPLALPFQSDRPCEFVVRRFLPSRYVRFRERALPGTRVHLEAGGVRWALERLGVAKGA